jgi:hypothetical protein
MQNFVGTKKIFLFHGHFLPTSPEKNMWHRLPTVLVEQIWVDVSSIQHRDYCRQFIFPHITLPKPTGVHTYRLEIRADCDVLGTRIEYGTQLHRVTYDPDNRQCWRSQPAKSSDPIRALLGPSQLVNICSEEIDFSMSIYSSARVPTDLVQILAVFESDEDNFLVYPVPVITQMTIEYPTYVTLEPYEPFYMFARFNDWASMYAIPDNCFGEKIPLLRDVIVQFVFE